MRLHRKRKHAGSDTSATELTRLRRSTVAGALTDTTSLEAVRALVIGLDARTQYTAGHSVAVAIFARDLAEHMGLDPEACEHVCLAGLLHDIGKVTVPDEILNKPGQLTDAEQQVVRAHPRVGAEMLAGSVWLAGLIPAVLHHHERIDGKGYPDGLFGDGIPLEARIISLSDAYVAMISRRAYRAPMAPALAVQMLQSNAGRQHSAVLVDAFAHLLQTRGPEYAMAATSEFSSGGFLRGERGDDSAAHDAA